MQLWMDEHGRLVGAPGDDGAIFSETGTTAAAPAPEHSYVPQGNHHVTASGRLVDPWAMRADDDSIALDDIAHHLAQEPRFGGACQFPYSVAMHSVCVAVRVAHYVLEADENGEDCDEADVACNLLLAETAGSIHDERSFDVVLAAIRDVVGYVDFFGARVAVGCALLHDAYEYVGKDIPQPTKVRPELDAMSWAEDAGLRVIRGRLGLPAELPRRLRDWIKRADRYETRREILHLLPSHECWGPLDDVSSSPPIDELPWREARDRFRAVARLCGLE